MAKIRELMRRREDGVQAVAPDTRISEAARAFLARKVSSLVVRENGRILGMFTKNDLTRCCADGRCDNATVADYMQPEVYTTTADGELDELVRTMVSEGFHHVPVVEDGQAVGVVTFADILGHQCRSLHGEEEALLRYIQGIY